MDLRCDLPVLHPMPPAEPTLLDAALRRAFDATRDVPVAGALTPWQFYRIRAEQAQALAWLNARLIEPETGIEAAQAAYDQWRSVPGWVVVTCLRVDDAEKQARLQERCLTAVQRVSLSLWAESVRTSWITDLVVESEEFYRIVGIDARRERAIGILWYGHAERRE
jgi:nitroreductase